LRDLIAHGKIEVFLETYAHSVGVEPPFFRGRFDELVSHAKALEAKEDTHAVARILHAAGRPHVSDLWFGDDPFDGPHGHASGSTQLL